MASKTSKIVLLVALGLLMGAPIISYFYLKSGYDYRLESLHVLSDKGAVSPFNLVVDSTTNLSDDDLKTSITVVAMLEGSEEDISYLDDLFEQYKERNEFRILAFVDQGETQLIDERYVRVNAAPSISRQFFNNTFTDTIEWQRPSFVLLDTAGHVRNMYPGKDKGESVRLVEHIAIVLPRTKKSDIIHKRTIDEE